MDNTIILVRALENIYSEDIKVGDIVEVNDDGEFWHLHGKGPNNGWLKYRFEVVDEQPTSDVWTTP